MPLQFQFRHAELVHAGHPTAAAQRKHRAFASPIAAIAPRPGGVSADFVYVYGRCGLRARKRHCRPQRRWASSEAIRSWKKQGCYDFVYFRYRSEKRRADGDALEVQQLLASDATESQSLLRRRTRNAEFGIACLPDPSPIGIGSGQPAYPLGCPVADEAFSTQRMSCPRQGSCYHSTSFTKTSFRAGASAVLPSHKRRTDWKIEDATYAGNSESNKVFQSLMSTRSLRS